MDPKTIIFIFGFASTIAVNLIIVVRFASKLDMGQQALKTQVAKLEKLLFTEAGKSRFMHVEDCEKQRDAMIEMIKQQFELLKYELMDAIDGKHKESIKRIHDRIAEVADKAGVAFND